jgi:two-component system response regulator HydG
VPLVTPPLRERREDIPLLAQHFVDGFNRRNGTNRTLTQGAMLKLQGHEFPGNVRELENVIEQAAALARTDEIDADDVFLETHGGMLPDARPAPAEEAAAAAKTLAEIVEDAEREAIQLALVRTGSSIENAARELNVSTTTLWRKMKKLGLHRE